MSAPRWATNDINLHGPVEERLAHAHHSAALLLEYLDDFAAELHPDFVTYFWQRIRQHAKRRLQHGSQERLRDRDAVPLR